MYPRIAVTRASGATTVEIDSTICIMSRLAGRRPRALEDIIGVSLRRAMSLPTPVAVLALSVPLLSVVLLSVVWLSVVLLSVPLLSVPLLSVVLLSVATALLPWFSEGRGLDAGSWER
jgi:hypothetical protein